MFGHKRLQRCTLFCALGAFSLTAHPVAAQVAAKSEPRLPKITDVKFLELGAAAPERLYGEKRKLHSVIQRARFRLALLGDHLACTEATRVFLESKDPGQPVEVVEHCSPVNQREIDVSAVARVGTVITTVKVTDACDRTALLDETRSHEGRVDAGLRGAAAATQQDSTQCGGESGAEADKRDAADSRCTAKIKSLTISIKGIPPESILRAFAVKFDHQVSEEFPNLHSLLVTKQGGDVGVGFDAKATHMRVDLEPTGATDLTVVQSNEEQLELHFVAAEDYEPTNVVITVYDGSDLDKRKPIYVARATPAAPKPPAKDPNEPTITSVDTVFVDRHEGNGRLRIYGKHFGKGLKPPPYPVDDFLCDCLERPPLDFLTGPRPRPCGQFANPFYLESKQDKDRLLEAQEAKQNAYCAEPLRAWNKWRCGVSAIVGVSSRDIDIRVTRTEILESNDEMVDVYFEFTRHHGFAWPFQLAGVDLTIQKPVKKVEQVVTAHQAKVSGEVDSSSSAVFNVTKAIGPEFDETLTSKYTVLAYDQVRRLLGDGVADNFYAIELSVVNDGATKVAIPLAAIHAEIEWLYGPEILPSKRRDSKQPPAPVLAGPGFFLEGPPTLAPVPMATVSAYFGASKKNGERRVRTFNILEGITTLVTSLVPFAGSSLKDAEVVFSGGFIPGLRHAWGDLSDQQLQNLTALSWQTSETVAANGGAMEKLIYIQRGAQFQDDKEPIGNPPKLTKQQISNIMGIEVVGYEVKSSPAKQATPAGKKPAAEKPAKAPPAKATPP